MYYSNKDYDHKLSNKYDQLGREIVTGFLIRTGLSKRVEDYKKYCIDILYYTLKGEKQYVEVEVRGVEHWTDKFRYHEIHVPYRKNKFYNMNFYFIVRHDGLQVGIIRGKDIVNSPVINKPTRFKPMESFYEFNINKVKFYEDYGRKYGWKLVK